MTKKQYFRSKGGLIPLPVFFPDATRAVLKSLDSEDVKASKTPGVLVNTYHLYLELGAEILKQHDGIRKFMNWDGGLISDSGGFQLMSLVKKTGNGKVSDEGIIFRPSKKRRLLFSPEMSIAFQMEIMPDMVVVLDDFTTPTATRDEAEQTVKRTIEWAKRSKAEYERICENKKISKKDRPYLLGVVQGGFYEDLRRFCAQELVKIGFDGFGYGGWPIKEDGSFDYKTAEIIAQETPDDYLLYGLGVGKPHEIARLVRMGYGVFDCVLPTRDARHKRMYRFRAESIDEIDLKNDDFWEYYVPDKEKHASETSPVSAACDCLTCSKYSRAYLAHLFKIGDMTAGRLATIHNLRFYSILMEKLRKELI